MSAKYESRDGRQIRGMFRQDELSDSFRKSALNGQARFEKLGQRHHQISAKDLGPFPFSCVRYLESLRPRKNIKKKGLGASRVPRDATISKRHFQKGGGRVVNHLCRMREDLVGG